MSAEDLERYETEIELQLYQRVPRRLPMFQYVVETERRFYLANDVKLDVQAPRTAGPTSSSSCSDAWVWDMYRPDPVRRRRARRHVQGRQRRGAPRQGRSERDRRPPAARSGARGRGRWSRAGTRARATRCSTATGACREGELDLVARRGTRSIVFCEVKTRRGDAFGAPAEAVTVTQAAPAAHAGAALARRASRRRARPTLRFDVASVLAPCAAHRRSIDVLEAAF